MSDTIADILERAAARVERGWMQGANWRFADGREAFTQYGVDGSVDPKTAVSCCIEGAVIAEGGSTQWLTITRLIGLAINNAKFVPFEWNDTPGRTQQEVVAALREAARLARERETVGKDTAFSIAKGLNTGREQP